MRKNSPRKWLHACLDLLPVILIPVFMIYSHRHTIDSYSITRDEPSFKDFYQYVENGKPVNTNNWELPSTAYDISINNDGYLVFEINETEDYSDVYYHFVDDDIEIAPNDIVYLSLNSYDELSQVNVILQDDYFDFGQTQFEPGFNSFYVQYEDDVLINIFNIDFYFYGLDGVWGFKDVQLFNLTHIFGSGNEPTKEVFESYLTQDYYNFGNNSVYVGMHSVVYNDTDIGSQFFYCLYNSVDKYFNMGNVFNLGGVYNWFIFNIMGGSSPLSLYIVWNIVLYEFVMDLLFLLYGLFMWFIDIVEHIMDKPFKSIK